MKILVACEYSGRVREAFRKKGHEVWSVDLLASDDNSPYHRCEDWRISYERDQWDMVIAFPPCTDLCNSGSRWWKEKRANGEQQRSIAFFLEFTKLPCRWVIENPVGIMSSNYRKPDQIIQPWQFGHGETKATCLWLNGVSTLQPTDVVNGREAKIHRMAPSKDRWKKRSLTYQGIANAMADQWG